MHTPKYIRDRDERVQALLHGQAEQKDNRRDDYTGAPLRDDER